MVARAMIDHRCRRCRSCDLKGRRFDTHNSNFSTLQRGLRHDGGAGNSAVAKCECFIVSSNGLRSLYGNASRLAASSADSISPPALLKYSLRLTIIKEGVAMRNAGRNG